MIIKMSLDDGVDHKFYTLLCISLVFYLFATFYLMIKTRANYLMDNIKHSYMESYDNYDLSDGF